MNIDVLSCGPSAAGYTRPHATDMVIAVHRRAAAIRADWVVYAGGGRVLRQFLSDGYAPLGVPSIFAHNDLADALVNHPDEFDAPVPYRRVLPFAEVCRLEANGALRTRPVADPMEHWARYTATAAVALAGYVACNSSLIRLCGFDLSGTKDWDGSDRAHPDNKWVRQGRILDRVIEELRAGGVEVVIR